MKHKKLQKKSHDGNPGSDTEESDNFTSGDGYSHDNGEDNMYRTRDTNGSHLFVHGHAHNNTSVCDYSDSDNDNDEEIDVVETESKLST